MIKPTTKVYRKQIIEGYSIPAFIKNGSYFFVDLDVYGQTLPTIKITKPNDEKKTTANKGFTIVGRSCKVQRYSLIKLLCEIKDLCFDFPPEHKAPKRWG